MSNYKKLSRTTIAIALTAISLNVMAQRTIWISGTGTNYNYSHFEPNVHDDNTLKTTDTRVLTLGWFDDNRQTDTLNLLDDKADQLRLQFRGYTKADFSKLISYLGDHADQVFAAEALAKANTSYDKLQTFIQASGRENREHQPLDYTVNNNFAMHIVANNANSGRGIALIKNKNNYEPQDLVTTTFNQNNLAILEGKNTFNDKWNNNTKYQIGEEGTVIASNNSANLIVLKDQDTFENKGDLVTRGDSTGKLVSVEGEGVTFTLDGSSDKKVIVEGVESETKMGRIIADETLVKGKTLFGIQDNNFVFNSDGTIEIGGSNKLFVVDTGKTGTEINLKEGSTTNLNGYKKRPSGHSYYHTQLLELNGKDVNINANGEVNLNGNAYAFMTKSDYQKFNFNQGATGVLNIGTDATNDNRQLRLIDNKSANALFNFSGAVNIANGATGIFNQTPDSVAVINFLEGSTASIKDQNTRFVYLYDKNKGSVSLSNSGTMTISKAANLFFNKGTATFTNNEKGIVTLEDNYSAIIKAEDKEATNTATNAGTINVTKGSRAFFMNADGLDFLLNTEATSNINVKNQNSFLIYQKDSETATINNKGALTASDKATVVYNTGNLIYNNEEGSETTIKDQGTSLVRKINKDRTATITNKGSFTVSNKAEALEVDQGTLTFDNQGTTTVEGGALLIKSDKAVTLNNQKNATITVKEAGSKLLDISEEAEQSFTNAGTLNVKEGASGFTSSNDEAKIAYSITNQKDAIINIDGKGDNGVVSTNFINVENDEASISIDNSGTFNVKNQGLGVASRNDVHITNQKDAQITAEGKWAALSKVASGKTTTIDNLGTISSLKTAPLLFIFNNGNAVINNKEGGSFIVNGRYSFGSDVKKGGSLLYNNEGTVTISEQASLAKYQGEGLTFNNKASGVVNVNSNNAKLIWANNEESQVSEATLNNEGTIAVTDTGSIFTSNPKAAGTNFIFNNKKGASATVADQNSYFVNHNNGRGSEKTTINNDGALTVSNKAKGVWTGGEVELHNNATGSITVKDQGSIFLDNQESGEQTLNNDGTINLENQGKFFDPQGNVIINNNATGAINVKDKNTKFLTVVNGKTITVNNKGSFTAKEEALGFDVSGGELLFTNFGGAVASAEGATSGPSKGKGAVLFKTNKAITLDNQKDATLKASHNATILDSTATEDFSFTNNGKIELADQSTGFNLKADNVTLINKGVISVNDQGSSLIETKGTWTFNNAKDAEATLSGKWARVGKVYGEATINNEGTINARKSSPTAYAERGGALTINNKKGSSFTIDDKFSAGVEVKTGGSSTLNNDGSITIHNNSYFAKANDNFTFTNSKDGNILVDDQNTFFVKHDGGKVTGTNEGVISISGKARLLNSVGEVDLTNAKGASITLTDVYTNIINGDRESFDSRNPNKVRTAADATFKNEGLITNKKDARAFVFSSGQSKLAFTNEATGVFDLQSGNGFMFSLDQDDIANSGAVLTNTINNKGEIKVAHQGGVQPRLLSLETGAKVDFTNSKEGKLTFAKDAEFAFNKGTLNFVNQGNLKADKKVNFLVKNVGEEANFSYSDSKDSTLELNDQTFVENDHRATLDLKGKVLLNQASRLITTAKLPNESYTKDNLPDFTIHLHKGSETTLNDDNSFLLYGRINYGKIINEGDIVANKGSKLVQLIADGGYATNMHKVEKQAQLTKPREVIFENTKDATITLKENLGFLLRGDAKFNLYNQGTIDLQESYALAGLSDNAQIVIDNDKNAVIKVTKPRRVYHGFLTGDDKTSAQEYTKTFINNRGTLALEFDENHPYYKDPIVELGEKSVLINSGTIKGNIDSEGMIANSGVINGDINIKGNGSLYLKNIENFDNPINGTITADPRGFNRLYLDNTQITISNAKNFNQLVVLSDSTLQDSTLTLINGRPNSSALTLDNSPYALAGEWSRLPVESANPSNLVNNPSSTTLTSGTSTNTQPLTTSTANNDNLGVLTLKNSTVSLDHTIKEGPASIRAKVVSLEGENTFIINHPVTEHDFLSEYLGVERVLGNLVNIKSNALYKWERVPGRDDFKLNRPLVSNVVQDKLAPLFYDIKEHQRSLFSNVAQAVDANALRNNLLAASGYEYGYILDNFSHQLDRTSDPWLRINKRLRPQGQRDLTVSYSEEDSYAGLLAEDKVGNTYHEDHGKASNLSYSKAHEETLTVGTHLQSGNLPDFYRFQADVFAYAGYGKSKQSFETNSYMTAKSLNLGLDLDMQLTPELGITLSTAARRSYIDLKRDGYVLDEDNGALVINRRLLDSSYYLTGVKAQLDANYRIFHSYDWAFYVVGGLSHSYMVQSNINEEEKVAESNANFLNRSDSEDYQSRKVNFGAEAMYEGPFLGRYAKVGFGGRTSIETHNILEARRSEMKGLQPFYFHTNVPQYLSRLYLKGQYFLSRNSYLELSAEQQLSDSKFSARSFNVSYNYRADAMPNFLQFFNKQTYGGSYKGQVYFSFDFDEGNKSAYYDRTNGNRLFRYNSFETALLKPRVQFKLFHIDGTPWNLFLETSRHFNQTKDFTYEKEHDKQFYKAFFDHPWFYAEHVTENNYVRDDHNLINTSRLEFKATEHLSAGLIYSSNLDSKLNNFVVDDKGTLNPEISKYPKGFQAQREGKPTYNQQWKNLIRYQRDFEFAVGEVSTDTSFEMDQNPNNKDSRYVVKSKGTLKLNRQVAWIDFMAQSNWDGHYNLSNETYEMQTNNWVGFQTDRYAELVNFTAKFVNNVKFQPRGEMSVYNALQTAVNFRFSNGSNFEVFYNTALDRYKLAFNKKKPSPYREHLIDSLDMRVGFKYNFPIYNQLQASVQSYINAVDTRRNNYKYQNFRGSFTLSYNF